MSWILKLDAVCYNSWFILYSYSITITQTLGSWQSMIACLGTIKNLKRKAVNCKTHSHLGRNDVEKYFSLGVRMYVWRKEVSLRFDHSCAQMFLFLFQTIKSSHSTGTQHSINHIHTEKNSTEDLQGWTANSFIRIELFLEPFSNSHEAFQTSNTFQVQMNSDAPIKSFL